MNLLRLLVTTVGLYFIAPALAQNVPAPEKKPNIIFILADDLGWTDLGCAGSKYYESPNIDRLASQGMRFTNGYTCGPNCQPSRAALLSGQYQPRTGVYTVGGIDRFDWQTRPLRPIGSALRPPMPLSTSSNTRVGVWSASATTRLMARATRDSSPPDAIRASARAGSPGLGASR